MVDLFFVLSGFVLAPIFPRYKELRSLKEFALKRFLRLAPLAWITIMFVLAYAGLLEIKQNLTDDATTPSMSIDFQSIII
jgi:peptidoglycan/LPS O-acetylase OafA/YrhL